MAIKREMKSGTLGLLGDINNKVNARLLDEGMYKLQGFNLDEALSLTKRAGYAKFNSIQLTETGAATFTGLFDYNKSDQTNQKIATGLTGVYRYDNPVGGAWNSLSLAGAGGARTGTANDLFDASVYDDLLYLGNGIDGNLKYDGTTMMNMGIVAPSTTATVALAAAGAGNLANGTYSYKITFYNSALGHESNPSSVTADVTVVDKTTDGQVALSAIPTSTDAQVTKRRIYRTTMNGGVWLLLATIDDNTTTTYTDNLSDASLGIAIDGFGNGIPPVFDKIEIWQGHAFMAGPNSSRINFSKSGKPNAVDSNDYRLLDANDGDVVTGIRRHINLLVAFKRNSIWNGSGEDRNSFAFYRHVTDTGSVNNACIVNVPMRNVLAFIDQNARFYFYNGTTVEPTALGLEVDLNALNQSQLAKIVGSVHKSKNQCRWIVPNGTSTQNDLMIWYDYIEDKWGTHDLSNVKANYIAEMKDSASRNQSYLAGYTGYVWQGDVGGSDDGSAITCEVIDRGHPGIDPDPEEKKNFYRIMVWFETASGTTITVSYALDDPDGSYTSLGTIDCGHTSGQGAINFNVIGNRIYYKITESTLGQTLVLRGWRTFYKVVGRAY